MEIVVGVTPDSAGEDALALAVAAARTFGGTPVLTHVYNVPYDYPSMATVDAEWRAYLREEAERVVHEAREALGEQAGVPEVHTAVNGHRSSGLGLAELAEARGAEYIVIGSAPGGSSERLHSGSTADQLFHGSPVPVLMAPHGYRRLRPDRISRVVVAYQMTPESDRAAAVAPHAALLGGLPLHLVTVIERVRPMYASALGPEAELPVLQALREVATASLTREVERLAGLGVTATWEVVEGPGIPGALAHVEWQEGDLFVVGSSGRGPLKRVFLGDMSFKLLRAATVATMVVPRRT